MVELELILLRALITGLFGRRGTDGILLAIHFMMVWWGMVEMIRSFIAANW